MADTELQHMALETTAYADVMHKGKDAIVLLFDPETGESAVASNLKTPQDIIQILRLTAEKLEQRLKLTGH